MSVDITGNIPTIVVGTLVGLVAFVPLLLALLPVLRRKHDANMAKGLLGVIASFAVLFIGVAVALMCARTVAVVFLIGELVGFFVGIIAIACMAIAL